MDAYGYSRVLVNSWGKSQTATRANMMQGTGAGIYPRGGG